jgi:cytochrome c-type biogenesis protein CcmE
MKKIHIVLLVAIAITIGVLVSFMGTLTTYETVAGAKKKAGRSVSLIARLDRSQPIEYDHKNPNYLSFVAVDSLGGSVKVVYNHPKPDNLEHSERLVLKGKIENNVFHCDNILLKCPSKYKDDMNQAKKNLQTTTMSTGEQASENNPQ